MKAYALALLVSAGGLHFDLLQKEDLVKVADFAPHAIVLRVTRRGRRDAEISADVRTADCHAQIARGGVQL